MIDTALPSLIYGTAWKEAATTELVLRALAAGFRAIDTANQPKHYDEEGVGRALASVLASGALPRRDLFVQTKFTFPSGQDHRRPYDADAPPGQQVEQSFRSSLQHLRLDRLDSYLLHGPSRRQGLGRADREAWEAMERIHAAGGVRFLGVSNVNLGQLEELLGFARVAPAFVQNRCFARLGWDAQVREFCARHGIVYQGFSLLTANREVLEKPAVQTIAARHGKTVPQVIFRFSRALEMIPLTGTTDAEHMRQDLESRDIQLTKQELDTIAGAGVS